MSEVGYSISLVFITDRVRHSSVSVQRLVFPLFDINSAKLKYGFETHKSPAVFCSR